MAVTLLTRDSRQAVDDLPHGGDRDAELACQSGDRLAGRVPRVNGGDSFSRELGVVVLLATWPRREMPSTVTSRNATTRDRVSSVFKGGAGRKVIRANTGRVVAMVSGSKSLGDWPASETAGNAMRELCTGGLLTVAEDAVPGAITGAGPQPAVSRLINSGPEAFLQWSFKRSRVTRVRAELPLSFAWRNPGQCEGSSTVLASAMNLLSHRRILP